jgi:hypothetical protein
LAVQRAKDLTADSDPYPGYHHGSDIPGAIRLRKALEAALKGQAA